MQNLPPDYHSWQRRAEWISRNYQAPSKSAASALNALLEFINGDTCSDTISHWCVVNSDSTCCASDADAAAKLLRLAVPFFGKGFAVPLLSRFKHYSPASSYVKVGATMCRILPQTLQLLKKGTSVSAEVSSMIDTLLADNGVASSGSLTEDDLQVLVGGLMEADMNYALQNSIRRNMMIKTICQDNFARNAVVIDSLLQPSEVGINVLFSRTAILHELSNLGAAHPAFDECCQKSRAKFFRVVNGTLGKELMVRYRAILEKDLAESVEFGMDIGDCPEQLQLAFQLVIVGIADTWRRLFLDVQSLPFTLFSMAHYPTAAFLKEWENLHKRYAQHSCCVDCAFTAILLLNFPLTDFEGKPPHQQDMVCAEIKQLLLDISTFAPLSSDLVEIKHGVVQWAVSRRGRQQVRAPRSAREITFLQAVIKQFLSVRQLVHHQTLPSKMTESSILKMVGTRSMNQYTKDKVLWKHKQPFWLSTLPVHCVHLSIPNS